MNASGKKNVMKIIIHIHRFKQNIVINFLYDIYRFYRFRKQIKYIHYRYMFLGYLKRKWGINLYKLWKYY